MNTTKKKREFVKCHHAASGIITEVSEVSKYEGQPVLRFKVESSVKVGNTNEVNIYYPSLWNEYLELFQEIIVVGNKVTFKGIMHTKMMGSAGIGACINVKEMKLNHSYMLSNNISSKPIII